MEKAITQSALRAFRAANGLTLAQFGEAVGVQKTTVWKWETGQTVPRRAHLNSIVKVTNGEVSANDFLFEPESV